MYIFMRGFEFIIYPSREKKETEREQTHTLGKPLKENDYIKK